MDLVLKDIGLFQCIVYHVSVSVEISPKLIEIFEDGIERYGVCEFSPNIIQGLQENCGVEVRAPGFPTEISHDEADEAGYELDPRARIP